MDAESTEQTERNVRDLLRRASKRLLFSWPRLVSLSLAWEKKQWRPVASFRTWYMRTFGLVPSYDVSDGSRNYTVVHRSRRSADRFVVGFGDAGAKPISCDATTGACCKH